MKLTDFERHLIENGCMKKREGGNHTIWENENGKIAPVPRHKELKNSTCKLICK